MLDRIAAEDGRGEAALGITAAPREHACRVRLVIERPRGGPTYEVLLGDIDRLAPRLLPAFDVANCCASANSGARRMPPTAPRPTPT